MTVDEAKNKLLTWASGEVGYPEGPNNRNKYAAMPEMTRLLGWNAQDQPWCNTFVVAGFITCFGLLIGAAMLCQQIGDGSVLCKTSAQRFKGAGRWFSRPERGDIVFFLVDGEINHMGIVTGVSGGSVLTIEGNSSDAVCARVYDRSYARIAGYGRPRWELAADEATQTPEPDNMHDSEKDACSGDACELHLPPSNSLTIEPPVLQCGMGGPWVAALQGILTWQGYNLGSYGVDGEFGVCTVGAVRNYQKRHNLSVDGIVGPMTWAAMLDQ